MKHYFRPVTALALSLMGSALVPALKADEWDKKTEIKIDHSIDVQGTVLPAGSYVMKLLGSSTERHTVQIFSADQKHLIVTILANPAYRVAARADSEFRFYEAAEGRPPALRTWFYPGDNFGVDFGSEPRDLVVQTGQRHPNAATSTARAD